MPAAFHTTITRVTVPKTAFIVYGKAVVLTTSTSLFANWLVLIAGIGGAMTSKGIENLIPI